MKIEIEDLEESKYSSLNINYMRTRDPMKEFFALTCKSVKLNSPHIDLVTEVDED